MRWIEVQVKTDPEAAEAVADTLSRYASGGVAIQAGPEGLASGLVAVTVYLPFDDSLSANKRSIEDALWHLGQIRPIANPSYRPVVESDWAEVWKERFRVLHIGRRLVVRPTWLDHLPQDGEIVIVLDPGLAFGTGLHPTTQMCLSTIEAIVRSGDSALDLGTGSGILAIAAAKMGATVHALDNDPVAVRTAQANAQANGVEGRVQIEVGSLQQVHGRKFDIVAANILAKVVIDMLHEGLRSCLNRKGTLIASGILEEQQSEVITALQDAGLLVVERHQTDDWVCLVSTPPADAPDASCSGRRCARV